VKLHLGDITNNLKVSKKDPVAIAHYTIGFFEAWRICDGYGRKLRSVERVGSLSRYEIEGCSVSICLSKAAKFGNWILTIAKYYRN